VTQPPGRTVFEGVEDSAGGCGSWCGSCSVVRALPSVRAGALWSGQVSCLGRRC